MSKRTTGVIPSPMVTYIPVSGLKSWRNHIILSEITFFGGEGTVSDEGHADFYQNCAGDREDDRILIRIWIETGVMPPEKI